MDPPTEVIAGVYIGSLASTTEDHLSRASIDAIINLSGICYKNARSVLNIVMDDVPVTTDSLHGYALKFAIGVAAIETAVRAGKRVLVHCAAGINRSATLIAFYLIENGHSYDRAVELLAAANKKRNVDLLTNPSFRSLLKTHSIMRDTFPRREAEFAALMRK